MIFNTIVYAKIMIRYILIILYIQFTYSRNYTINTIDELNMYINRYNKSLYVSKNNIENNKVKNYIRHYYCKNNNCIELEGSNFADFIEFQENNEIKRYIIKSCIYDDKLNNIIDCNNYHMLDMNNETNYIDLNCKNDSECFYNKCIDNYCVYNEDPSITHCDYVHKGFAMFQYTFVHCGKTYDDICKHDNECSSYSCNNKRCIPNYYVPSESTDTAKRLETLFFYVIIVLLFIICCCICACIDTHKHKQKKQFSKLEINKN